MLHTWQARDPKNQSRPLAYLAHQNEFRFSLARTSYLAGGWRSGKSYAGLGFCELKMGLNPGCMGAIIEPDYKMLRDFINNKFRPAFAHMITGESKQDDLIFLKDGVKVVYLSGHNIDKLEQYELGWLLADEVRLMNGELYMRANARVNDPSAIAPGVGFVGTPEFGWLSNTFAGQNDAQRRIIHIDTEANPYLTVEFLESLYASCPAHLAEAFIKGRFVPPGGSVYPMYSIRNQIPYQFHKSFLSGCVIDWAPRTPHVLFYQLYFPGDVLAKVGPVKRTTAVVYDELILDGKFRAISTPELCRAIIGKGHRLDEVIADPAGKAAEATSGTNSLRQARLALGMAITIPPGNMKGIEAGVEHVSLALAPMAGAPTLYISNALTANRDPRAVHNAFSGYHYPKDKEGKPLDATPVKDGVSEHAMDDVRYLIVTKLPAIPRLMGRVRQAA